MIFREHIARRVQGHSSAYEVALIRPDSTRVPCRVNASPLVDEHEVTCGSFGMFTDITDQKRAEAELKDAMQKAEEATQMKSVSSPVLFTRSGSLTSSGTARGLLGAAGVARRDVTSTVLTAQYSAGPVRRTSMQR